MNIQQICLYIGLCVGCVHGADAKTLRPVILIAFDESDTSDQLFRGGENNFWFKLRRACAEHGFLLTTKRNAMQESSILVAFNAPAGGVKRYNVRKKILYTWEPATVLPRNFDVKVHSEYDVVMTWHDGLVDGKKYHKFNYALQFGMPEKLPAFTQKKLCTFFGANKSSPNHHELYSKRLEGILFFEKNAPQEFDLYGPGWQNIGLKTYRGYVADKLAFLKNYRFALAYENMQQEPGYITEKIFDTFSAGCVPVYYGAPNIAAYIPSNCFIDRRLFVNDAELYRYLKNMPEEQYEAYLANIRAFLHSKQAAAFSCDQFVKTFIEVLERN